MFNIIQNILKAKTIDVKRHVSSDTRIFPALHKSPKSQIHVSLCHLIFPLENMGAPNSSSFCIPLESEKSNNVRVVKSPLLGAF